MVLVEFLNLMGRLGQYTSKTVADTVERLANDPNVEIVSQTSFQFMSAASLYASRLDQRWSVTDCASFLLMEERRIRKALAHDRDFAQAGFDTLLRED